MPSTVSVETRAVDGELVLVVVKRPPPEPISPDIDAVASARSAADEARWLSEVDHPGIVQLHRHDPDLGTIETVHAGTTTLRTGRLTPDAAANVLASAATTLADLHEQGRAHGNLGPDHIVLAPERPVLCSPHGAITDEAADLAALARCIRTLLAQWEADRPAKRALGVRRRPNDHQHADRWRALADQLADDPGRPGALTARRAATRLADLASRPPASTGLGTPVRRSRPWGLLPAAAATAVTIGGLAVVGAADAETGGGVVVEIDGTWFALGSPGDHAIVLDRPCDGDHRVLLLDRSSDTVWGFDTIDHGHVATPVAIVPGAASLGHRRSTDGTGRPCSLGIVRGREGSVELAPLRIDGGR